MGERGGVVWSCCVSLSVCALYFETRFIEVRITIKNCIVLMTFLVKRGCFHAQRFTNVVAQFTHKSCCAWTYSLTQLIWLVFEGWKSCVDVVGDAEEEGRMESHLSVCPICRTDLCKFVDKQTQTSS